MTAVLIAVPNPVDGPYDAHATALLPAVAVDQSTGPMATRTLVLAAGPEAAAASATAWSVAEIGDAALTVPLPDAEPLVAAATRTLVAPAGNVSATTAARGLLRLGIGFVVATRPVPGALAQQLDTTAGLTRLGESGSYALWRVEATAPVRRTAQPPARVRLCRLRPGD